MRWTEEEARQGTSELELRRFSFFFFLSCLTFLCGTQMDIVASVCLMARMSLCEAMLVYCSCLTCSGKRKKWEERGSAQPACPQAQGRRAPLGDGAELFHFPQQMSPHPALSVLPVTLVTSPSQFWLTKNEGLFSEAGGYQFGHSWHTGLNKFVSGSLLVLWDA